MREPLLSALARSRAEAAFTGGQYDEAWEWLQTLPQGDRPAAWVAGCLDFMCRRAAASGDWAAAENLAKEAASASSSAWRQERLALLRRRRPMQSDEEWEVLRASIAGCQRLKPTSYSPDLDQIEACGAYYARGGRADSPWSKYLRMGKSAWTDPEEREAVFAIAARHFSRYVRQATDLLQTAAVLVPIPANPDRYAARMVSLPDALVENASSTLALPAYPNALTWSLDATDIEMKKLSRADRWEAAERAYVAGPQIQKVRDHVVLLVDDITTSGATMRAAARVLRSHGASGVVGCCLAHTEG